MWWVVFRYVRMVVVSFLLAFVFSTSVGAWSRDVSPDFIDSDVKVYHSNPCPGNFGTINVSGEGSAQACIMGQGTRVASYFAAQGGIGYAISFPFESNFYRLDVCQEVWGCVFGEPNDTFVGVMGIYKNFTANLRKSVQSGVVHYSPKENSSIFSVSQFGDRVFTPQSVAVSQNGKWVLVELRTYGFLRINVETSEVRRIIAPGPVYGYGYDPLVEMAITNDGSTVAVAGFRMGLSVVVVDDTCGDRLNELTQKYYTGAVTSCAYVPTATDRYIQQFVTAFRPIFSQDGKTLSFDAFSNSVAARHITMFSDTSDSELQPYYLALGDSFTSGEGEIDDSYYLGGPSNKCHVSSRSYPFLLANSWNMTVRSAACSGATMQTARGNSAKSNQPAQLTELEVRSPQVTTVGMGGNDAGLIGKLKDCLGVDTCKWASSAENRRQTAMEIKNLYPHLKQFYADVKVRTLGAVIVIGYPRIITSQQDCASTVGALLNQTERVFMNEAIHYLNQVILAATVDVGVEFANVEQVLSGGELCSSFEAAYMNGLRIGNDYPVIAALPSLKIFGAESFHPKPEGHAKVAAKIFQDFSYLSNVGTYMNTGYPTSVPAPGSYWNAEETNDKPQRAVPFLSKITIKKKDLFEISFPAFTFMPATDIVLEIHSYVKNLGTFRSAEDGSLNATISSIDFDTGYHSVHAIGKNFVENDVDIYDFLEVEEGVVSMTTSDSPNGTLLAVPDVSAIISTRTGSSKSLNVKTSSASENRGEVLGTSVTNTSALDTPARTKEAQKSAAIDSEQNEKRRYNWVIILALIIVLLVSSIYLYFYNRQKQPRNPT